MEATPRQAIGDHGRALGGRAAVAVDAASAGTVVVGYAGDPRLRTDHLDAQGLNDVRLPDVRYL